MTILPDRLAAFFARFPSLLPTIRALNAAGLPFAIGGNGCLFLLGNDRLPDDVDIYLPNGAHDVADGLFGCVSYRYRSSQEDVRNSNPGGGHAIQLTSDLRLSIAGKGYGLALTAEVLAHRLVTSFDGEPVWLYPPEDVLLIKALLQRGPEVGKRDLEDIERFSRIAPGLRFPYLGRRVRTLGAEERVRTVWPDGF